MQKADIILYKNSREKQETWYLREVIECIYCKMQPLLYIWSGIEKLKCLPQGIKHGKWAL